MYSAAPVDWATGHSLKESYPSAEMQSVYSAGPATRPDLVLSFEHNAILTASLCDVIRRYFSYDMNKT